MPEGNGSVSREEAEQFRLVALSAQSERDDVVLIEMLYRDHWVRLDVSAMEAQYLSAEELVKRYLVPAFEAMQLHRTAALAEASAVSVLDS